MMKRLLFLLTVLILTSGCSKDDKTPMFNENLTGKKFRANAYVNGAGSQVYEVLEFKSTNEVISEYRLSNDNPVNINNRVVLKWRNEGTTGTSIVINYRSFTDDENDTKDIKGIVTDGIITLTGKTGPSVFTEY